MDASILIVGSGGFLETLVKQVQSLAAWTVEVAPNSHEAMPLIQAQQPDLLLLEATQESSLDLCRQIKEQTRISWIYCILVGDSNFAASEADLPGQSRQNQLTVTALEQGADAVLWLSSPAQLSASREDNQLLYAQMLAGLRSVRNHREIMRTNDLLSAIALSDPLTELNNRRALEWELPRQIQNARVRSAPLSLLMLDVDYFKSINDTYGHLVGDHALKLLSARLRHNLRFYDTPFRYGGEEFVVTLSNTDCDEAPHVARRLCHLIGSQPFAIDGTLELTITVSVGIASLQATDDVKGMSLLHRADQNLLRAKSTGRNRVVSCKDKETVPQGAET